ncbi:Autophagy protein 5 [Recurvomyces mirabilis]|uniref:Autophagy protein 5 n=1 Tax=Recurvomyces mirabilis TaxID=574656 RepID=A0AAE0WU00_9PEZI|nr:Autophagy protein 5 [Recurvomyces mirabilis]KAK5157349.1 Autophagy protein 5 [Recurvomyces mirabilis]
MPVPSERIANLQTKIWSGSLPLEIRLAAADCRTYDQSEPYIIQYPRLSYLAFLLPRLYSFFATSLIHPDISAPEAWLSFEDVPLKWNHAAGLLYDLYSGADPVNVERLGVIQSSSLHGQIPSTVSSGPLPWRLTVHYSDFPHDQLIQLDLDGRTMLDAFINAVKEADFIRNGTARTVMSLSKEDSDRLWLAVRTHDRTLFNSMNTKLLNPPGLELRHVPIKVYLPTSASQPASDTIPEETTMATAGHIRVVQFLAPLLLPSKHPQTLGTALNTALPTIFPSRRNPLLAQPVLHGAAVPMVANLEELSRAVAYTDGFLHVAIVMLG